MPVLYLSDAYLLGMGLWLAALTGAVLLAVKWRRRRRLAGKPLGLPHAALMLWLLLVLLTLPELYCALFYDTTDSFGLTNVSRRWHDIHVPRSSINAAGYRDSQPFEPKLPAGHRRLCFAGDSFTFGHGVADPDDRFSDRIAAELDRARPGRFRVNNAAIPGRDVRDLVDVALPEWIQSGVQIDVLVYVFVLNDVEYLDERTGDHYRQVEAMKPQFFLFRDTYFYNLLYFRWQQLRRPGVRDYFSYLAESYQPDSEAWQRLTRKLDELRALCRENGIDLRIVLFPFLHNLGPGYPFAGAHRRLSAYFEEHGVPVLDLEPVLAPHADGGLTVNRFDAHPNERAHALAAEAIRERLLGDLFDEPTATD